MRTDYIRLGIYVICLHWLITAVSCTKTEEPPKPVGTELPYTNTVTRKLAALLDSIPEASIYRAAFKRTTIQRYMDSVNAINPNTPYTLFVPVNKAWEAAGYTMDKVNAMPAAVLDTLVRYITVVGGVSARADGLLGETNYYPLTYREMLTRTQVPNPFNFYFQYYYRLCVGQSAGVLRLNGKEVSHKAGIPAVNGTLFLIDSLVTKPFYESYQVLAADTSFSFYMAALKKSNALYQKKGILGSFTNEVQFNDTCALTLMRGDLTAGLDPAAIVFAPDNNAFRKAGFNSIADINTYIDHSALAAAPSFTRMLTNMDSILVNHRLLINIQRINSGYAYLYTAGLRSNAYATSLNNSTALGAITYRQENGQIVLHRQDAPQGRGAVVTGPSDITTLTGVIHRVDNLLLPTP